MLTARPIDHDDEGQMDELISMIEGMYTHLKVEIPMPLTKQQLKDDLEGKHVFVSLAFEGEHVVVGYLMYYFAYCSYNGRYMFMEDLYAKEGRRGRGIGTFLLKEAVKIAATAGMTNIDWQVVEWNTTAIDFYDKMGAHRVRGPPDTALIYRLDKDKFMDLLQK